MSAPAGLNTGNNPSWSLTLWNKVHRYRCLLFKYWWVVLLTVSLALCVTAYFQMNKPPTFVSSAKLIVKAPPMKGPTTTDSYSLAGLKQALDRVSKDCK